MPFKSMAIALLVPPTSLLFLAIAGLVLQRWYRRIGGTLLCCGLIGLLLLGMPAVSGFLIVALEQNLPLIPPPDAPPQAIVILGGDIQRSTTAPHLQLGALSLERVQTGAALARQTGLPILVTGGRLRKNETPLAVLMAESLAQDFRTSTRWVEPASADTWENARFSADILRPEGIKSIYVVTEAWHMRRAIQAFAGTGLTVTAAPTHFDRPPTPIVADFVPDVGSWRTSYFAMHEWIGWFYYHLR